MKMSALRKVKNAGKVNAALKAKIHACKTLDNKNYEMFKEYAQLSAMFLKDGGTAVVMSPWGEAVEFKKETINEYFN